jgi:hypothetical protein
MRQVPQYVFELTTYFSYLGIKCFVLADACGYVLSFWVYQGAQKSNELGLSAKPFDIVINLIESLPHDKNYIVVADSFYGSLALAEELQRRGWCFILACRGDRPTPLFNSHLAIGLQKGQWKEMTNKDQSILAMSFYDIKKVFLVCLRIECIC